MYEAESSRFLTGIRLIPHSTVMLPLGWQGRKGDRAGEEMRTWGEPYLIRRPSLYYSHYLQWPDFQFRTTLKILFMNMNCHIKTIKFENYEMEPKEKPIIYL